MLASTENALNQMSDFKKTFLGSQFYVDERDGDLSVELASKIIDLLGGDAAFKTARETLFDHSLRAADNAPEPSINIKWVCFYRDHRDALIEFHEQLAEYRGYDSFTDHLHEITGIMSFLTESVRQSLYEMPVDKHETAFNVVDVEFCGTAVFMAVDSLTNTYRRWCEAGRPA